MLLITALPISAGRCDEHEPVVFELPYFDDLLIVPVTVSNEQHFFVIDSGASCNAFHTDLRSCLGEPIGNRSIKGGGGNEVEAEFFRPPDAHVGTVPVTRRSVVACLDLTPVRSAMGRDIQGILGIPFFATNIIQVDFDLRELRILPKSTEPTETWGSSLDVVFTKSNRPVVRASLGGHDNEPCLIDTGFSGTFNLRAAVYDYLLQVKKITSRGDTVMGTIGGIGKSTRGSLSESELAGYEHQDLLVLRRDGKMSLVGLDYLRRYLVTFDFGNGKIYLAKGLGFDEPDEEFRFGFGMLRSHEKTVIQFVEPASVADNCGLRTGDELLSVVGKEIGERPIAEIFWIMRAKRKRNKSVEVEILRDGSKRTLMLTEEKSK